MTARRFFAELVGLLVLAAAIYGGLHFMESRALTAMLAEHERQWRCWDTESAASPVCAPERHVAHIDADWCRPAVEACRDRGLAAAVHAADAQFFMWAHAKVLLNWVTLLAATALLLRGAWHGVRRLRR